MTITLRSSACRWAVGARQQPLQVLDVAAFHFLTTPGLTGAEEKSPPNMLSSSFGEYLQHGREFRQG
jgi:hypothetical protein